MSLHSNPFVSVVIPTYNRGNVITKTVQNILRQTYTNFELIVVDDGSTDGTDARLASFAEKIRIVRQENSGAARARNRGIEEARGEIIAFQDSDDEWHPTKLARQVALMNRLGASVPCCVCNAIFRSSDGIEPEKRTFSIAMLKPSTEEGVWLNPAEVLATRPLFFNQVVAARKSALVEVGGFRPGLKYLEDWDLALKLSMLGPWGFIQEPLTYWNPGSEGSFTARAETDAEKLHQCASQVLVSAIAMATAKGHLKIIKYLKKTLKVHERSLFALRLKKKMIPGSTAIAFTVSFVERCRSAVRRRSRSLPMMLTEGFNPEASTTNLNELRKSTSERLASR
jgi:glycosyltransferase involved in cell wall biosynthesis